MTNGNKTNAPGFTLMEMMVAVALMAMMIAVFGTVISRTKDAVTFAQSTIQRERESAAVSGIIQRDMAMITNKGFLKVEDGAIAFSVTGPNESVLARDYGDLSADAVKDTTSGDDAGKSWAADTWKGGYIRFTEAVETGTLQTVTEFTGTDMVDKGWAPDQYAGSIVKITGVSES